MTGTLFAVVIIASRTGDWSEVYELIRAGHITETEARRLLGKKR